MIKLSDDEILILGRPNFACAKIAKVLIASGVYEKGAEKAEYEQAVFIHWASNLLKEHGSNWRKEFNEIINAKIESLKVEK
jgi:hypothetical protein